MPFRHTPLRSSQYVLTAFLRFPLFHKEVQTLFLFSRSLSSVHLSLSLSLRATMQHMTFAWLLNCISPKDARSLQYSPSDLVYYKYTNPTTDHPPHCTKPFSLGKKEPTALLSLPTEGRLMIYQHVMDDKGFDFQDLNHARLQSRQVL